MLLSKLHSTALVYDPVVCLKRWFGRFSYRSFLRIFFKKPRSGAVTLYITICIFILGSCSDVFGRRKSGLQLSGVSDVAERRNENG